MVQALTSREARRHLFCLCLNVPQYTAVLYSVQTFLLAFRYIMGHITMLITSASPKTSPDAYPGGSTPTYFGMGIT
jgi:hypothetical protein